MKNRLFLAACFMMSFAAITVNAGIATPGACFACEFVKKNAPASSNIAALVSELKALIKEGNADKIAEFVKIFSSNEAKQAVFVAALLKEVAVEEVAS
jgi:hypothetical protein